jgi:hypothetical protein
VCDKLFYNERAVVAGLISAVKLKPMYYGARLTIYVSNEKIASELKTAIGIVKDLEKIVILCEPQQVLPS